MCHGRQRRRLCRGTGDRAQRRTGVRPRASRARSRTHPLTAASRLILASLAPLSTCRFVELNLHGIRRASPDRASGHQVARFTKDCSGFLEGYRILTKAWSGMRPGSHAVVVTGLEPNETLETRNPRAGGLYSVADVGPVCVATTALQKAAAFARPVFLLWAKSAQSAKRNGASAANRCTDAPSAPFPAPERAVLSALASKLPGWSAVNRLRIGVFAGFLTVTAPPVRRLRLPRSLPVFVVGRLSGRWPARCCASRQTSPCRRGLRRWPLQRAAAASRGGSQSSSRER